MNIHFVRSGGFAGLRVEGDVTLDEHGGVVSSDKSAYRRTLTSQEADALRPGAEAMAKSHSAAPSGSMRDGFQYDVSIESAGSKLHCTFRDGAPAPPEEQKLMEWLRHESASIFEARAASR